MEKEKLLNQLAELTREYKKASRQALTSTTETSTADVVLSNIEQLLKDHLAQHPQDTDIWFKIALLFDNYEDQITSIECMDRILEYDPHNAYARILSACFMDIISVIDETQFSKIADFYTNDNNIMSMVEFMKSRYYFPQSLGGKEYYERLYEQALKKSIELCDKYVWNYKDLAYLYTNQHRFKEAQKLYILALSNVQRICDENCHYDFLSVERFINEYITGIWINSPQYQHILALLANFAMKW